jgi:hypothetical protein
MSPSVVKAVDAYVASFATPSVPAQAVAHGAVTPQISRLGAVYAVHAVHGVKAPKGSFGRVAKKTKALPQRSFVTLDGLLASIKTRYAYLLQLSADGTHYVIDLTSLAEIAMRKRYRTLGCTLRVSKDLTAVEVQPTDTTTPTGQLAHLGQIALAVFALLKEAVVKIWTAVAPSFSAAVTATVAATEAALPGLVAAAAHALIQADPALAPVVALATPVVAAAATEAVASAGAAVEDAIAQSVTQKTLFPFQSGLGAFLQKVDAFLLGPSGLLYHLTGMDYVSMVAWLKAQVGALNHVLPNAKDATLAALPVVQLGTEYYNHFVTYIEDALKKGQLVKTEIDAVVARTFLPAAWSGIEKLAYILWSLTYNHTLTLTSAEETFSQVGSVLTLSGESVFQGIQAVVAALLKLFGFKGTSLVAASDVLTTPALARKFISLNELVQSDATYAGLEALAPSKVSLVPV